VAGPVIAGLGIIARYIAKNGIRAAIQRYGSSQVKKATAQATRRGTRLKPEVRETLRKDRSFTKKAIKEVEQGASRRRRKPSATRVAQGKKLRADQDAVSQAKGALKGAGAVAGAAAIANAAKKRRTRGELKRIKEQEAAKLAKEKLKKLEEENKRLRKEVTDKRKAAKGFPFKSK
jgi:hypothetical protein